MSFHEVRFPTGISLGSRGGPERRTEIVTLASGYEERNSPWADSRRLFNAGYGVRSLDDIYLVIAFFEARRGRLHGFRFRDFGDWKSGVPGGLVTPMDQPLGTGDGVATQFKLTKTYSSGGESYIRRIAKPVAGTVRIASDAFELSAGTDFAVDSSTGEVTFTAPPAAGEVLTAGFEFDVPVRFDQDRLEIDLASFNAGQIPDIPLREIRL
ncbi:MAG TPA: TIGR02217 family protein [Alphaproteobacteria bacterium]|nr:TIGR02217 family protein [Alphaproteobacteria bacterium]HAM46295.1 TIGR02217 family protein [Alphaproteobacteria bacterium]HBA43991.1 TIGR02217 family protein [Alphaproteobacteria bacterium]HBC52868.1 TIGR02217 family protein [Alphaproteobacteria bacterium]HBF98159.1 TIGR02217 family protein [Alphaproteobacteria bacterium]